VTFGSLDTPLIELGSLDQDLAFISGQVHTVPSSDKYQGVMVLTPACLESFLYDILGTFVDDSVILDGTSIWRDRLNQRVADPSFSLSLAPHHPDVLGGERFTPEGYLSEDYDLIRDGILTSFRLSDYTARKTGLERSRNNAYGHFIVSPGDRPVDAIIAGIDRGILVGRFSGGNPGTSGDFSGVAKNTYLIEGGVVKEALSETMVTGNLADLLMNIRAISSERVRDGSSVLPFMAFDGVIISGK